MKRLDPDAIAFHPIECDHRRPTQDFPRLKRLFKRCNILQQSQQLRSQHSLRNRSKRRKRKRKERIDKESRATCLGLFATEDALQLFNASLPLLIPTNAPIYPNLLCRHHVCQTLITSLIRLVHLQQHIRKAPKSTARSRKRVRLRRTLPPQNRIRRPSLQLESEPTTRQMAQDFALSGDTARISRRLGFSSR